MLRDAARYLPCLSSAHSLPSMFEVKVLLAANEVDDGRPILFEQYSNIPNAYAVLGGKVDNIFDIIEVMENSEAFRGV